MSFKDTWTPQDTTMDASPDIPNMLADAIIQNEADIKELRGNGGSGEKELFTVTFTQAEDGTFTPDKTYEEVLKAYNEEKIFNFVVPGDEWSISAIPTSISNVEEGPIIFSFSNTRSTWAQDVWIFNPDNSCEHHQYDLLGELDSSADEPPTALAVKTYVDNAVADSAETLIVHVHIDENSTITTDKTYTEVKEAIDSGKIVEARGISPALLPDVTIVSKFAGISDDGDLVFYSTGTPLYSFMMHPSGGFHLDSFGALVTQPDIVPKIELWQPNTWYEVDQYVLAKISGTSSSYTINAVLKCKADHTSESDSTNFLLNYGVHWSVIDEISALTCHQAYQASTADMAIRAQSDDGGNNIRSTYATKTALAETEAIAKGRATGYVFDTVDDMNTWLADEGNVGNLVLGDNLYIRAKDVPDYWWDGSSAQELETQKVDLTEYATKEWSENYINETILGGAW